MNDKAKPTEFWTAERCFVTELVNRDGLDEVSIARIRVEPGVTTQLHSLSVAEWYVVEAGTGIVSVGDQTPRNVTSGDVVAIPVNVAQRIQNNGTIDLVFVCVCAPRFLPESYTSLE